MSRRTVSSRVRQGKVTPAIITMGGQFGFRWSEVEQQMRDARERDE